MGFPRSRIHPDSGSALILTLLITSLLATIAVSFLSTSRVEQIAARNFSRQNAASGLAELATQQAMAKIQQGFNTSNATSGIGSTSHTQIVTTQPGQITKYFFSNGNCTGNSTTNLYSSNGTSRADLNNLQNPGNTTQIRGNVSANQTFTITGNTSNRLIVNMEDISNNGTLVGRIAYYVDDELTKLNINGATDNRTTLNVSLPRSLSLSAFTTANISTFKNTIDGTLPENKSSITNWGYFFRNEQADNITGFNGNQMSNISTAPLSDFHLKYTPWGTRRLHINDEPLNSTGVENIFSALSSIYLTNIYGQNFNDKYGQNWSWTGNIGQSSNTTANGLKQIAANMLQMRLSGWSSNSTGGYRFTDAVIRESSVATFPPTGYFAHTPSACINEFAFKMDYLAFNSGTVKGILVYPKPTVEFFAPFSSYNIGTLNARATLQITIQEINFTVRDSLGNTVNCTKGPFTVTNSFDMPNVAKLVTYGSGPGAPALFAPMSIQMNIFNNGNTPGLTGNNNLPWTIVGNPTVKMGDIKLFAGNSTDSSALRDWLSGSFINSSLGNGTSILLNTPLLADTTVNQYAVNFYNNLSLQRIDPRVYGSPAWLVAPYTFCRNGTQILSTQGNNDSKNPEWGHNTYNATGFGNWGLRPSETASRDIPGDTSPFGNGNEPDYFLANEHSWVYFNSQLHTFDMAGNATFNTPHDLGKVPTNVAWRRLRFMPRHFKENAANLIPDWAMLDVISFSSNNSSSSNLKIAPINPNGSFAVDSAINNSTITPRNNIPALVKALETSSAGNFQLGSSVARSGSNATLSFDKIDLTSTTASGVSDPYTYFRGSATALVTALSSNITSNSTTKWSTANSTWSAWRTARKWPSTSLILPSEVAEICGVSDYGARSQYNTSDFADARSIKENEGRLSAFFPGLTLQSNLFTIYAFAQAGRVNSTTNQFEVDSEALTKTLVEVEITSPATATTPAQYKVKKLYTQPIQAN